MLDDTDETDTWLARDGHIARKCVFLTHKNQSCHCIAGLHCKCIAKLVMSEAFSTLRMQYSTIDYPQVSPHGFAFQSFNHNQCRIKQCTNTSTSPAPASLSMLFLSAHPRRKGEANSFHQSSFVLTQILHSYEKLSRVHTCP